MHSYLLLTAIVAAAAPLTTDSGAPVGSNQNSKTAGARGSVLLEDFTLIEKLARFDRERIPERVVHARGVGAYGTFESAGDFSALTRAKIVGFMLQADEEYGARLAEAVGVSPDAARLAVR